MRVRNDDFVAWAAILAGALGAHSVMHGRHGSDLAPSTPPAAASAPARTAEAPEPPGPGPSALPFAIDSHGTGFSVVGRYEGAVQVFADSVVVWVEAARVGVRPGRPGPSKLESIRVGLAGETANAWSAGRRSDPLEVGRLLQPGEGISPGPLRFTIPGPLPADLGERWLVFIHTLRVDRDGPAPYHGPAWTYAHGERGFFLPGGVQAL